MTLVTAHWVNPALRNTHPASIPIYSPSWHKIHTHIPLEILIWSWRNHKLVISGSKCQHWGPPPPASAFMPASNVASSDTTYLVAYLVTDSLVVACHAVVFTFWASLVVRRRGGVVDGALSQWSGSNNALTYQDADFPYIHSDTVIKYYQSIIFLFNYSYY